MHTKLWSKARLGDSADGVGLGHKGGVLEKGGEDGAAEDGVRVEAVKWEAGGGGGERELSSVPEAGSGGDSMRGGVCDLLATSNGPNKLGVAVSGGRAGLRVAQRGGKVVGGIRGGFSNVAAVQERGIGPRDGTGGQIAERCRARVAPASMPASSR